MTDVLHKFQKFDNFRSIAWQINGDGEYSFRDTRGTIEQTIAHYITTHIEVTTQLIDNNLLYLRGIIQQNHCIET